MRKFINSIPPLVLTFLLLVIAYFIWELISIVLNDYFNVSDHLSLLGVIVMISVFVAFYYIIYSLNNKRSDKEEPPLEKDFIDREEIVHDLLNYILTNRLTILFGQKGLGKSKIMRRVYYHFYHDKKYCDNSIWITVNENSDYERFLRDLFQQLFKYYQKGQLGKLEEKILDELHKHQKFIFIDSHICDNKDQNNIYDFILKLRNSESNILISTDYSGGLKDYDVKIELDPLERNDRKKLIKFREKNAKLFQNRRSNVPDAKIWEDVEYFCIQQENTLALIKAVELYSKGVERDDALIAIDSEFFKIEYQNIKKNPIKLKLLSAFYLLDFYPNIRQLVKITSCGLEEINKTIDELLFSPIFSYDISFDRKSVIKIDLKFKNYLKIDVNFDLCIDNSLYEGWIIWAIESSEEYGGRHGWDKYIYLYNYLSTYCEAVKYCFYNQKYEEILLLWTNLDFFLSNLVNTREYEEIGIAAEIAATKLDEKQKLAIIQSEVFGYIYSYLKPYSEAVNAKALEYLDKSEKYFRDANDEIHLANNLRYRSRLLIKKAKISDNEERMLLLTQARDLSITAFNYLEKSEFPNEKRLENICLNQNNLSLIERLSKNFDAATQYQNLRIQNAEEYSFKDIEVESYYQLGRIHQEEKNFDDAIIYYEKALKITENDIVLNSNYHLCNFRLAEIYYSLDKFKEAERNIKIALKASSRYNTYVDKRYIELTEKIRSRIDDVKIENQNKYHEKLPINIDPSVLPLRNIAPCWSDGDVKTVDYDTKEAICLCKHMRCCVDNKNVIIHSERIN